MITDSLRLVRAILSLSCLFCLASAPAQVGKEHRTGGMLFGVQAWTFTRYTTMEAIEKVAQAGGTNIELFPGQVLGNDYPGIKVGPDMGEASTQVLRDQLKKFGVNAVAFGVVGIDKDPEKARVLFRWAKSLGIAIINTESTDALDTMDKMVAEFDMRIGFHDHPRTKDPNYRNWDPTYILSIVKNHDRRIGSCADIGHWVRSGIKPIDALRILKGRVISCHMKDLNEFSPDAHDVPFGTGVSDIPAVLDELRRQGFRGSASIEYEYNWESSVPDVAQCIGFVRGYLAGRR